MYRFEQERSISGVMKRNDPSDRSCHFGLLASTNRLPNWHLAGDDLAEDATKKQYW